MYHVPGSKDPMRSRQHRLYREGAIPIGRDGATDHRYFRSEQRPAGTHTVRSLYNAHAGIRSFIVFPPDVIGVYLDWRTQEMGVAAVRSSDRA